MRRDPQAIRAKYLERRTLLDKLAKGLERELQSYLQKIPHIDRVYCRAKGVDSFVEKACAKGSDGQWKYEHPFEEIEDQVAGRILVFYRRDVDSVQAALSENLKLAEHESRKPASVKEFDYETTHMICVITPDLRPRGWREISEPPETFEIQIRTLAQHAWSEPQHGVYKKRGGLKPESTRKLYWAAASAWGMDSIWEELQQELLSLDCDAAESKGRSHPRNSTPTR